MIKKLYRKLKTKFKYSQCYNRHEYDCKAAFGLCDNCDDTNCPYYFRGID